MWPKKQANRPLLKPGMFCRTLCRGQNLGILPGPFGHCLQNVWRTPTQNCQSKRCHLGAPIPIWKWTELSESYGIYAPTFLVRFNRCSWNFWRVPNDQFQTYLKPIWILPSELLEHTAFANATSEQASTYFLRLD